MDVLLIFGHLFKLRIIKKGSVDNVFKKRFLIESVLYSILILTQPKENTSDYMTEYAKNET